MLRISTALLALAALSPLGCARPPAAPHAWLRVIRPAPPPPDDARDDELVRVYVDGRLVGRRGAGTIGLPEGTHRVELRAEGRFHAYREVRLRKGERLELPVALHPDLDVAPAATGAPPREPPPR